MQQNKLVFLTTIIASLTGCASTDEIDTFKRWDNQYKECRAMENNNRDGFPETPWFDSLKLEDKQLVVGYLYQRNSQECMREASAELRDVLIAGDFVSMQKFFKPSIDDRRAELEETVATLDRVELDKMIDLYPEPFTSEGLIDKLNLWPEGWNPVD